MTTEIIKVGEIGIIASPELVLENARMAAKALADVISKKKKPVIFGGEQYLEFEDWQTCGQFYGYAVRTRDAVLVEIAGVKGAKAQADLINLKTGEVQGGAEAYCMRDEENWNTRPKFEWQGEGDHRKRVKVGDEVVPWFQLASMAQTRAGAKCLRNRLAWVVVLAGYRATPAEEMEGVVTAGPSETEEHWCAIHKAAFFKKGKMRSYAHPIEGTDKWCHEPKAESQPEQEVAPAPAPAGIKPEMDLVPLSEPNPEMGSFSQPEAEPTLKNLGDLFTLCHKQFGLRKEQVLKELGTSDQSQITDLNVAWQTIKTIVEAAKSKSRG